MDQNTQPDGQVPSVSPPPDPVPTPVASALGQTVTQKTVDDSALPNDNNPPIGQMTSSTGLPPASDQASSTDPTLPPPTAQTPPLATGQPIGDNRTIKLPVPTNTVPALAVGVLILVLLAAVAAYAFLV